MSEVKTMSSIQFPNTQQPYQVNDARIPADPGAYKYMATDGEGNWVAEDRLAYKTFEPATITWDGNTDGLETFQNAFFKVSNQVLNKAQLLGQTLTFVEEEHVVEIIIDETNVSELPDGSLMIKDGAGAVAYSFVNPFDGASAGLWFLRLNPVIYVSELKYLSETTHRIPDEYLPNSVAQHIFRVNITYDADNSAYVSDKTYAELKEAETQQKAIVGTLTDAEGKVYTIIGCDAAMLGTCYLVAFDLSAYNYLRFYRINVEEGGLVHVDKYEIAATAT